MMAFRLQNLLSKRSKKPPQHGLFHYVFETQGEKLRAHLRIDPAGSGILAINANQIFHLNPTAAQMAYLILEKTSPAEACQIIAREFDVPLEQIKTDYEELSLQIEEILHPDGGCPVCALELDTLPPFSASPSAPYRMDLALTYRCNNACAHCYNARPRSYPELTTPHWKQVIDKLWDIGIPHIVFTGGEPTLRPDLPELIAYAEKKGQITGLNSNGRKLADEQYVQSLIQAGLDHVQITLESHLCAIHDQMVCANGAWQETIKGIQNAVSSSLYVMTNTTMLQANTPYLTETLDFLGDLKVPTIGLNALIYSGKGAEVGTGISESELPALLQIAREKTEQYHQKLIWYTPTQYCHFDPVQMDLGVKGCTAALYNMCIEPDGAVIPCQSYYSSLGNILKAPWDSIWNHSLALSLRNRHLKPEKCNDCSILSTCGGGCPLQSLSGMIQPVPERIF